MNTTAVQRPGIYRRHIRLHAAPGAVRADMEDDSHRFGVIVRHDGRVVRAVEGLPMRTPWTLCSGARDLLFALVGMQLAPTPLAAARHTDQKQQCTHMFDLATLAIAHAARGIAGREYHIEAPWYLLDGPRTITLRRDGDIVWTWTLERDRILTPEPFATIGVRQLLVWAEQNVRDPDEIEALFITRRAALISGSRLLDLDPLLNPAATGHGVGACYVHQPDRMVAARRNLGSTLDFTDRPQALLADIASSSEHVDTPWHACGSGS